MICVKSKEVVKQEQGNLLCSRFVVNDTYTFD